MDPVTRMPENDAASRALGIELADTADGTATARMRVREDMVNGHGIVHGAFVFAVVDTAFASCNSHGPVSVAAAVDITFVAPAHAGDLLEARAEQRTRFGRSGLYDVTVRRGADVGEHQRDARSREELRARAERACGPPGPARAAGVTSA